MTEEIKDEDCVSKKPWSEVLNRSLKLFTFNMAREGGKSIGKVIFYAILGLIFLGIVGYVINSVTGWFDGLFNFWPFGGEAEPVPEPEPEKSGWFDWGSEDTPEPVAAPVEPGDETRWYCKWNPVC